MRSFWKFVSKLDRRETRRYLQMFYTLMMRPLIAKVTRHGLYSALYQADLLAVYDAVCLQALHCLASIDAAHRLSTCEARQNVYAVAEHCCQMAEDKCIVETVSAWMRRLGRTKHRRQQPKAAAPLRRMQVQPHMSEAHRRQREYDSVCFACDRLSRQLNHCQASAHRSLRALLF